MVGWVVEALWNFRGNVSSLMSSELSNGKSIRITELRRDERQGGPKAPIRVECASHRMPAQHRHVCAFCDGKREVRSLSRVSAGDARLAGDVREIGGPAWAVFDCRLVRRRRNVSVSLASALHLHFGNGSRSQPRSMFCIGHPLCHLVLTAALQRIRKGGLQ